MSERKILPSCRNQRLLQELASAHHGAPPHMPHGVAFRALRGIIPVLRAHAAGFIQPLGGEVDGARLR